MYWSLMGVKGLTTQRKSFVKNHNNLSIIIQKSWCYYRMKGAHAHTEASYLHEV